MSIATATFDNTISVLVQFKQVCQTVSYTNKSNVHGSQELVWMYVSHKSSTMFDLVDHM